MKIKILLVFMLIFSSKTYSQVFTTNATPVGMEHNVLFNAVERFQVTQTGNASLNLNSLFDGKFLPSYSSIGPSISSPTVVLIENLPNSHTQAGAWIGWSTRFWESKRFKIEGYDSYNGNVWKVLADYSNQDYNGGRKFVTKIHSSGVYKKLKFTFYTATGTNGRLGVSELFYIHPEAVSPYQGLISSSTSNNLWNINGSNIDYSNGNIGIGTTDTKGFKLGVNGKIVAEEVKVAIYDNWADFVFDKDYKLPTLKEVEIYIKEKGHLKEIPSAKEVKRN